MLSTTATTAVPIQIEQFVEADEAAKFLHSTPITVKAWARAGRIPAHPFGDGPRKRWFFLLSELSEHLRSKVNFERGDADRDSTKGRRLQ